MAKPHQWPADLSKKGKIKKTNPPETVPLISTRTISIPTQRLLVVSLFVTIQALKLASCLNPKSQALNKIQFLIVDVLFIVTLPILSIPWLCFRPLVTLVQCMVIVGFDLTLFGHGAIVWWALTLLPRIIFHSGIKRESLAGRGFTDVGGQEHLLGKYIVNFLPESSAYMNSLEPLCIHGEDNGSNADEVVYAHVVLNNTWPAALSISHTPFDDDARLIEFSAKDLKSFPKSEKGDELWIPLRTIGVYQLVGILDSATGMPVRIAAHDSSPSAICVPNCPTVRFNTPPKRSVCAGEEVEVSLTVKGLAPLNVFVEDQWVNIPRSSSENIWEVVDETITFSKSSGSGSATTFTASKVEDYIGNVADIPRAVAVDVVPLPSARVRDANKRWPLLEDPVSPDITVHGQDSPYEIVVRVNDSQTFATSLDDFTVNQPGKYELVEIRGQMCTNKASGSFDVFIPPPLALDVEFEQVQDRCAGPSGINAGITLHGTPPFKVYYRTINGNHIVSNMVADVPKAEATMNVEFKPLSVGSYIYEFTAVEDRYRRIELEGPEYSQTQRINELAGASFVTGSRTRYCPNEPIDLAVKLQGKAPLSLKYDLMTSSGTAKSFEIDGINADSPVNLDIGVVPGGTYYVQLKTITDTRGCTTDLARVRSPEIYVRRSRPVVRFAESESESYWEVENKAVTLPLDIQGSETVPPFILKYEHDNRQKTISLREPRLHLDGEGTYRLLEFRDSECEGQVAERGDTASLSYYQRPGLEVIEQTGDRCIGSDPASFKLLLSGKPPFTVWHESVDPHGHSVIRDVSTSGNTVEFQSPGDAPGEWKHFWWLTDANYPDVSEKNKGSASAHVTIHGKPDASWAQPGQVYEVCAGDEKSHKGIPVVFVGQPPFRVSIEGSAVNGNGRKWYSEYSSNAAEGYITKLFEEAPLGLSQVRIRSVSDGNGCEQKLTVSDSVTINRRPATRLQVPVKRDYCLGDKVELSFDGHGPYKLAYLFEGKKQTATFDTDFVRYASQPGNMSLVSVSDQGSCATDLTGESPLVVHPLPSSRITHDPLQNIRLGDTADLTFEFLGTPPFTFTYTRTINGKVKSKKTIKNVNEHLYTVRTEKDGVYEVISLTDAYCTVFI